MIQADERTESRAREIMNSVSLHLHISHGHEPARALVIAMSRFTVQIIFEYLRLYPLEVFDILSFFSSFARRLEKKARDTRRKQFFGEL